jgi:hypothetical protein
MMQSALRRRFKNSERSSAVVTPAEFPFLDVEPSAPTTRVPMTGIRSEYCYSHLIISQFALFTLKIRSFGR